MRHRFVTADVFTDTTFGGNPLAVLPEASGLADAAMQ
jgi:trans-2,3-dihydro-3-hydroxyanthranilate isomerase